MLRSKNLAQMMQPHTQVVQTLPLWTKHFVAAWRLNTATPRMAADDEMLVISFFKMGPQHV
ncbi:MAG: hypothetical protein RL189_2157 [Pseudomonadota bacterium]|jgi:hypothetical protein